GPGFHAAAQQALDRDGAARLAGRARRLVLQIAGYPAAIDEKQAAVGEAQRRDDVIAGGAALAAGAEKELVVVEELAGRADMAEFHRAGIRGAARHIGGRRRDRGCARGDQPFLPVQPLELPDPEPDKNQEGGQRHHRRPEGGTEASDAHGHLPPRARWRYCSAMRPALSGRSSRMAPTKVVGSQSTIWTQIGGANLISTSAASSTTNAPRMRMTKTAGPSPASCAEMSRPHTEQLGTTSSIPAKTLPRPQRGQRQRSAAVVSETGG